MSVPAGRLSVGIVGAGQVGPVIGRALAAAQHRIVGIATTSPDRADAADALLDGVAVLPVPELVAASDLVVLAIPADQLEPVARGLAEAGVWRPGQLVMHTAAEHGAGVLAAAAAAGVIPLALHPAIAFTGTSYDLARLAEGYCAVTAASPVLPIGQALAVELGCEPIVVAEEDRPAYAEAVATATQFSREIVRQSTALLAGIGIENPAAVVGPLVRASIDRALMRAGETWDPSTAVSTSGEDATDG